jgi:hypothetical protein
MIEILLFIITFILIGISYLLFLVLGFLVKIKLKIFNERTHLIK